MLWLFVPKPRSTYWSTRERFLPRLYSSTRLILGVYTKRVSPVRRITRGSGLVKSMRIFWSRRTKICGRLIHPLQHALGSRPNIFLAGRKQTTREHHAAD